MLFWGTGASHDRKIHAESSVFWRGFGPVARTSSVEAALLRGKQAKQCFRLGIRPFPEDLECPQLLCVDMSILVFL